MATPDPQRSYRVSAFIWTTGEEPDVCELVETQHTEALDASGAIAQTQLEVGDDVERLVIEAQRVGMPLSAKAPGWAPWRIVTVWLAGHGERADVVREQLGDPIAPVAVVSDDEGNLGVCAALAGHLDGEATLDLEDALEAVFDRLALEFHDALHSTVETAARMGQPSMAQLREELMRTAEYPMTEAFPRPVAVEVKEVAPVGPQERGLMLELLLKIAQERLPSVEVLAAELGTCAQNVEQVLVMLERWGLALTRGEGEPPMLVTAGKQFLRRDGRVPVETLEFLPGPIDDLNAREALRRAGFILIDEFTQALSHDDALDYARELVPPAFAAVVDSRLAIRLYAAASALMVRLAEGQPAGCVAEEIVAVRLMQEAEAILDFNHDLEEEAAAQARGELRGLFELFEDDDVLNLFEMADPGDAAVAGHDPINQQMGVADQRVEAWFEPFAWTTPAGHLDQGADYRWP